MTITFTSQEWLGPGYAAPMTIDGKTYHHVEGWMQADKHGTNAEFAREIRRTPSASQAREMGAARVLWADMDLGKRALTAREVRQWDARKREVLRRGLHAKFRQHPGLCRKLLDTGQARLVYDDPHPVWGWAEGRGQNAMGEALEAVRLEVCHSGLTNCEKLS